MTFALRPTQTPNQFAGADCEPAYDHVFHDFHLFTRRRARPRSQHLSSVSLDLIVRDLTENEQAIVKLCHQKYGASDRDEVFFLDSGEAMFQVWGSDGDGPWVHLTNLGSWLADGSMTEKEITEGQI